MAFSEMITVESPQFYLDLAFRTASKRAELLRNKTLTGDRLQIVRQVILLKIETIHNSLSNRLFKILKTFPQFDTLPPFYQELVRASLDYAELKQSLGAVNWANNKINAFTRAYKDTIIRTQEYKRFDMHYKAYLGRVSSVMKQIGDNLEFLKEARKILVQFPNIKTSLPTVTIFGFPNVGKTTLLYRLTGSKPDIQPYAFTTKTINIAYLMENEKKIQLLDTPGTLNRFNKMNDIEKQAYIALKYCTNAIVYVFDLTVPYPLDDQVALLRNIQELKIPIVVYLAKSDIVAKKQVEDFSKKYPVVASVKDLKAVILRTVAEQAKPTAGDGSPAAETV